MTGDKVYVLNASGNLQERAWADVMAENSSGSVQRLGDLAKAYMRSKGGVNVLGSGAA